MAASTQRNDETQKLSGEELMQSIKKQFIDKILGGREIETEKDFYLLGAFVAAHLKDTDLSFGITPTVASICRDFCGENLIESLKFLAGFCDFFNHLPNTARSKP